MYENNNKNKNKGGDESILRETYLNDNQKCATWIKEENPLNMHVASSVYIAPKLGQK